MSPTQAGNAIKQYLASRITNKRRWMIIKNVNTLTIWKHTRNIQSRRSNCVTAMQIGIWNSLITRRTTGIDNSKSLADLLGSVCHLLSKYCLIVIKCVLSVYMTLQLLFWKNVYFMIIFRSFVMTSFDLFWLKQYFDWQIYITSQRMNILEIIVHNLEICIGIRKN